MIFPKINIACISFPLHGLHVGLILFLIHAGVWEANSLGCTRSIFQGGQRLKLPFLGGQDKFSRGVMMVRASWGKFSGGVIQCHPLVNLLRKVASKSLYGKNRITRFRGATSFASLL